MKERITKRSKPYRYKESGLGNILLVGIYEDSEGDAVIPNIEKLHEMIAQKLSTQKQRLNGQEIRFLRSHIGYSAADFAKKLLGVEPETVSRWENGKQYMSRGYEIALRMGVLMQLKAHDYDLENLEKFGTMASAKRSTFRLVPTKYYWKAAA